MNCEQLLLPIRMHCDFDSATQMQRSWHSVIRLTCSRAIERELGTAQTTSRPIDCVLDLVAEHFGKRVG
jgi:hypothetical protein